MADDNNTNTRLDTLNSVYLSGTTKSWADSLNANFAELDERKTDIGNTSTLVHDASYVHTDNNFTDAYKQKLDNAEQNVQADWSQSDSTADDYIKNKPTGLTDFTNDGNFVQDASYVHTDSNYTAAEKTKLGGISTGATKVEASNTNGNIKIDSVETTVYTEPADVMHDGDVPSWALESTKPTYTASEVGADPAGTASSAVSTHNSSNTAHSDIRSAVSPAQSTADTAKSIAEGRDKAQSYTTYSAMVTALNAEASATAKVGDNVYVETVDVPDFWVSKVNSSKTTYTYTTDSAIISAIATNGYIDIGWYRLAQLESTKVDLSGYVPTSRTVNNKALSSNITLDSTDVGALADTTKYGASLDVSGTTVSLLDQDGTVLDTITTQDTTYSNLSAASGGTDVSLVTTGDKYNWNTAATQSADVSNKMDKANPTGTGSFSLNRLTGGGYPVGTNSVAVGGNCVASGNYSTASGYGSDASGDVSNYTYRLL